jgi:ABC-type nitrate/sulfonate/bicarbonate transport system permease component
LTTQATEIGTLEALAEAAAAPKSARASRRSARWRGLALPLALAAAWSALSASGTLSSQIFPSPQAVLRDLWRLTAL